MTSLLGVELTSPRALLLGAALLPVLVVVIWRSLADLTWPQRLLSLGLRFAFLTLLGLALARPYRTSTSQKVSTVVLVDVSDSVSNETVSDDALEVQKLIDAKPADATLHVVTFAQRPRVVALPDGGTTAPALARHDAPGSSLHLGAGSNLQAAAQLAYGLFDPGTLKRLVFLSDGLQTEGDVATETERAKRLGVRVFAVQSPRPVAAELAAQQLRLPETVRVGETFELHADLYASRPLTARARLFQGETLNPLEETKALTLPAGPSDVVFRSVVRAPGEITYTLELDDISEDTFRENNKVSASMDVPGRPAVLVVEGSAGRGDYLRGALTAQQYDVDLRGPGAFPASAKELERYDFLVVSDTSAAQLGIDAQTLIETYVRDQGGGFLFAGGEHGYGPGGWAHSTVERILPVHMDAENRSDLPNVALSLVIDRSGSMTGQPMEMAKAAARASVDVLQPNDLVEVIAFDSQPTRYVRMTPARRKGRIENDIARIQPGGGTEIFAALDAAYKDMSLTQARKKHVILLTDGKASSNGIREVTQAMAAESITVTTVGLGADVDDGLLSMIKDIGGGRFHKVTDPTALPKIFTTETETISQRPLEEDWVRAVPVSTASFLQGIDVRSAPYLHGYVPTQIKPAPAQEILQTDRQHPLLARWRVGLGWSLAWTSDLKNRWAVEWLRWPSWGPFWGQLIREHMRAKQRREFTLKAERIGAEVRVQIDALDGDERFENGLTSGLTVTGPLPAKTTRQLPMPQTAPGRYEASFLLDAYGSYVLKAEHERSAEPNKKNAVAVSYGHVSYPYPTEYARFEPDHELLAGLAASTGGLVNPAATQVFEAQGEAIAARQPLWPRAVFAALVVFLLDLLVRRTGRWGRYSSTT